MKMMVKITQKKNYYYICQGEFAGFHLFVCLPACLSVRLFVCLISQKAMNGFQWDFDIILKCWEWDKDYIVQFRWGFDDFFRGLFFHDASIYVAKMAGKAHNILYILKFETI